MPESGLFVFEVPIDIGNLSCHTRLSLLSIKFRHVNSESSKFDLQNSISETESVNFLLEFQCLNFRLRVSSETHKWKFRISGSW
jgi:hypothetical protein